MQAPQKEMNDLPSGRLGRAYTHAALLVLGTALALCVVNLVLWPVAVYMEQDPVTARYGREIVEAAYPNRSGAEVRELLGETWSQGVRYAPHVQFREQASEGKLVNVHAAGFRHSVDQGPWPPDPSSLNVFLFGGSTLFGYGVSDHETLPSLLQPRLRTAAQRLVKVYNFGRGAYYSSQERILFQELLLADHRPDLVIFVDGLNDFYFNHPQHTERLGRLLSDQPHRLFFRIARHLPALRVATRMLERRRARSSFGKEPLDPRFDDPDVLDQRIARYLGNIDFITNSAAIHGIQALFVVQPVPTHGYDLAHHPFAAWGFDGNSASGFGYPRLERALRERPPSDALIWAADLQRDVAEPLYIDQVHYSPAMIERLAVFLTREIERRQVFAKLAYAGTG